MRNWMVDKREQEKSEGKVFPQDDTTITQTRDNEKIGRVEAIAVKFGETEKSKRQKERDKRAEEKKQMEKEKRSRNVMEKRGIYEGGKNTVIPVDTESKNPKNDIEKAGSNVKKLKNEVSVSKGKN